MGRYYNHKSPILVQSRITQFPPDLNLPISTYIRDPSFGAVPLWDDQGRPFGYLVSAGHGGETVNNLLSPFDAPLRMTTGRTKGMPCARSIASPSARRSLTSTNTISAASPLIMIA
jgi:hypothetical protein